MTEGNTGLRKSILKAAISDEPGFSRMKLKSAGSRAAACGLNKKIGEPQAEAPDTGTLAFYKTARTSPMLSVLKVTATVGSSPPEKNVPGPGRRPPGTAALAAAPQAQGRLASAHTGWPH